MGLLSNARAQTVSNQLEFGISSGRVIRHNAKFKPVVNGPSFLYQLSWIRHKSDSLAWRKAANFPRVGLTLILADCAPNDVFGYGIGVSPFIDFTLRQRPKSRLDLRLGTGLAYFTEAYDPVSNPENNVIGSHLNTIVHLGIHHQWILNSRLSLGQGIDLIHFSNGRSTSPNLGINTVAKIFCTVCFSQSNSTRYLLPLVIEVDMLTKVFVLIRYRCAMALDLPIDMLEGLCAPFILAFYNTCIPQGRFIP